LCPCVSRSSISASDFSSRSCSRSAPDGLARSWLGRFAVKRLESAAPRADGRHRGRHGPAARQIAVATRRLEGERGAHEIQDHQPAVRDRQDERSHRPLKAEFGERTVALQALAARKNAVGEQMHVTAASCRSRPARWRESSASSPTRRPSSTTSWPSVDARDKLAKSESRHAEAMASLRVENSALEEPARPILRRDHQARARDDGLKRQVEAAWASEAWPMPCCASASNDVAVEVVRVAHCTGGLGLGRSKPCSRARATELDCNDRRAERRKRNRSGLVDGHGGDDSKGSLARRIRSLQKRAARVSSAGGPELPGVR